MAKRSSIISNWPKYVLQWGVLVALILFLTGLIPGETAADPEAYCPMGGLQAFATYLAQNSLPCSMSSLQVMMGLALVAAVVLFSKLFCGYLCPLGTVQDIIKRLRVKFRIKSIKIANGSVVDKVLRIIKYALLFLIFYMTVEESELFCKNLDPYYAVATGFQGEITLWMSIVSICVLVIGSLVVDMFWCRYLCPLGAISNSLKFWVWIGVLFGIYYAANVIGAGIPWAVLLGAFCIIGYLLEVFNAKPKYQILHVLKNESACNNCGLCQKMCPYHIDLRTFHNGKINHVDCTLCGECVAACANKALNVGIKENKVGKFRKVVPALLAVALTLFGIWAGGKIELPTIDMKWNTEDVASENLQTTTFDNLRTLKCYGSAMTFKAKMEKVPGVHGVKVFVTRQSADILYNAEATSPEKIREAIYIPSRCKVQQLDPSVTTSLKTVVIRTEGMYEKGDLDNLGAMFKETGRKIYWLESEFACPLIVRVIMDAGENLDEDWFEEIVEKEYDFVKMEDEVIRTNASEYISKSFKPFKVEIQSRIEKYGNWKQNWYEVSDLSFDNIDNAMPFLSNYLTQQSSILGVYLELNADLVPTIRIRYVDPMTEDKIKELLARDTWTISNKGELKETKAKIAF
ncbi:MAG: 4Fe-4S binding protein [Bacteroidales bacterium]|nr:4Fe-4S binding protein [Bacteroidales bacterium]